MKLLSKRTSRISKFLLLFNLVSSFTWAQTSAPKQDVARPIVLSSDRYLMKILDRTVSLQDLGYQVRNLKALQCIYQGDAYVSQHFHNSVIKELETFMKGFPARNDEVRKYLHAHEDSLKAIRTIFKMVRYSEDQKTQISPQLLKLLREGTKENKCEGEVLYKDTLKTNFITLVQLELYLRSRYGGQMKNAKSFESLRPSIDLFVESLDKQFSHEYYW